MLEFLLDPWFELVHIFDDLWLCDEWQYLRQTWTGYILGMVVGVVCFCIGAFPLVVGIAFLVAKALWG